MLFELWGATDAPQLALPARLPGIVFLIAHLLLFSYLLYHYRQSFRSLSRRQWLATAGLALASVTVSQLFPISIASDSQLAPLGAAQNPSAILVVFGAAPFLLAGLALNPAAALVVGLTGGLGRALWQSHQVLEPFHFALAAVLAAEWMQQNYHGRLYEALRQPVIAGAAALALTLPLLALQSFAYAAPEFSALNALDLALSTAGANALPSVVEGAAGGFAATLLAIGMQLRPYARRYTVAPWLLATQALRPSPQARSLNRRLLDSFVAFALSLTVLLLAVGFQMAVRVSTQLVVNQMGSDVASVAARIPEFRSHRQHLLVQFSEGAALLDGSEQEQEETLRRLFRAGDNFRRIILTDDNGAIVATYPAEGGEIALTDLEAVAVDKTLTGSEPFIGPAREASGSEEVLSVVVPVLDTQGRPRAALIGRVPDLSLREMIVGLQGTVGQGSGFIVDENNQIIAHPNQASLLATWSPPQGEERRLPGSQELPGVAYEGRQPQTNARELVYFQTGPDHPWTAVITVPYEVVLRLALQIGGRSLVALALAMSVFGMYLVYLGRSITRPINDLMAASQSIAGGSLNTPIHSRGEDEIGRLGNAFAQMQAALKKRVDELSLLLGVSREVLTSLDVNQSMPVIMQGTLRGTGAAGVRVVVLNPSARLPLAFGEGPAAKMMGRLDRQVMALAREQGELTLSTPEQVAAALQREAGHDWPLKAIYAQALYLHDRFQGIFWLSYRQAHTFDQTELNLLRTLAGQATLVAENARLYATSEGGRRRLMAVLSSTTDAVIVTDQTDRILLVNPAMEQAFSLKNNEVFGLPVAGAIRAEKLVAALTSNSERPQGFELIAPNGRVLYASVSPVQSGDTQPWGRVAVLHDITHLKELDTMKSVFVDTVSHDLRSPLTFMRGYVTMLPMHGDLTPKQQEYTGKILHGIDQMSTLVEALLHLARLESGVDLPMTTIRVEELLAGVARELNEAARSRGLQLALRVAPGLPTLKGEPTLVRQALVNLVDNAINYAPDSGDVVLSAVAERGANGQELIIAVSDRGPGIGKQHQLRLFEKFYRAKDRANQRVKGSGLGLALVKSIAERHGGRAWLASEPGKGTTFFLSFPAEPQV